jgi:hypothetical protein
LDLPHPLAQIMLPGADRVPPAVAREARHRILAFERRDHVAAGRMLAGKKDPNLHGASQAAQVASSAKLVDDPRAGGKERACLYIVTEFGAVNVKGLSSTERGHPLIALAHPEFRDELKASAKVMHLG